jgi:hypothetical protein
MPQDKYNPANTRLSDRDLQRKRSESLTIAQIVGKFDPESTSPEERAVINFGKKLVQKDEVAKQLWNNASDAIKDSAKPIRKFYSDKFDDVYQLDNEISKRKFDKNRGAKARINRAGMGYVDDPNEYGITALGGTGYKKPELFIRPSSKVDESGESKLNESKYRRLLGIKK